MKERLDLGVPLAKIIRDLDLDINSTSAASLIRAYTIASNQVENASIVKNSLFPTWLDNSQTIMSNPDGWYYTGFFPWGSWSYDSNN